MLAGEYVGDGRGRVYIAESSSQQCRHKLPSLLKVPVIGLGSILAHEEFLFLTS
jgi:hypothetical protein